MNNKKFGTSLVASKFMQVKKMMDEHDPNS
jgi:hypothetical protein